MNNKLLKSILIANIVVHIIVGSLLIIFSNEIFERNNYFIGGVLIVTGLPHLFIYLIGGLAVAFVSIAGATKLIDIKGAIGAIAVLGGMALVLNSVAELLTTMKKTGMSAGNVFKTLAGVFGTVVVVMTAMSVLALLLGSNSLALIAVVALAASLSAILLVM